MMVVAFPPHNMAIEMIQTQGASPVAAYIDSLFKSGLEKLKEPVSLGAGITQARNELQSVESECAVAGWDGYDAVAVDPLSVYWAKQFLNALPLGVDAPSLSAEPDGQISLEWYQAPKKLISISVDPRGTLHYASMLGASKAYGSEPFSGRLPRKILGLIHITNS